MELQEQLHAALISNNVISNKLVSLGLELVLVSVDTFVKTHRG